MWLDSPRLPPTTITALPTGRPRSSLTTPCTVAGRFASPGVTRTTGPIGGSVVPGTGLKPGAGVVTVGGAPPGAAVPGAMGRPLGVPADGSGNGFRGMVHHGGLLDAGGFVVF